MKDQLSKSEVRRLMVVIGPDWWVDSEAKPNGIGPVCFYCKNLIDWGPTDHGTECLVRDYIDLNEEAPGWT